MKKIEVQGAHESLFIVIEPGAIAASLFLMLPYHSNQIQASAKTLIPVTGLIATAEHLNVRLLIFQCRPISAGIYTYIYIYMYGNS